MAELSGDTRLNLVLDGIPGALDYIVSLDPHDFSRLRHPALRRYMSPRISLRRVAAIAGLDEAQLIADLDRLAAGLPLDSRPPAPHMRPRAPASVPEWMRDVDPSTIPWVDVVPIDEVSGDPFPPISLAVKQLPAGGVLGIRHRWEPQPLYDIWAKMDLQWFAQPIGDDEWYVFVHRPLDARTQPHKAVIGAEVGSIPPTEVVPRLQVLAEQLEPGQTLEATGLDGDRLAETAQLLRDRLEPRYSIDAAATLTVTRDR